MRVRAKEEIRAGGNARKTKMDVITESEKSGQGNDTYKYSMERSDELPEKIKGRKMRNVGYEEMDNEALAKKSKDEREKELTERRKYLEWKEETDQEYRRSKIVLTPQEAREIEKRRKEEHENWRREREEIWKIQEEEEKQDEIADKEYWENFDREEEEREDMGDEILYYTNEKNLIVQAGGEWAKEISLKTGTSIASSELSTEEWRKQEYWEISEEEAEQLYIDATGEEFPEGWKNVESGKR